MKTVKTTLILLILLDFVVQNTFAQEDEPYMEIGGHPGWVYSVAFHPEGHTIASGGSDHTIRLWDAKTGAHLNTLADNLDRDNEVAFYSVAFSPDGHTIASGSDDWTIRLWDTKTGKLLKVLIGDMSAVFSVAFSPDGQTLASGGGDGAIYLWDTDTEAPLQTSIATLALYLLFGFGDLEAPLETLDEHWGPVYSVAFSPDKQAQTLASGSYDDTIRLWYAKKDEHQMLNEHTSSVNSVAFSPDGQTLASGSYDHTIRLWDAKTGEHLKTLNEHTSSVNSVAFSPDERIQMLASGSRDGTIRLWDAKTGEHLKILTSNIGEIYSVAFSPDGKKIVSGSSDGIIRLWDLPPDLVNPQVQNTADVNEDGVVNRLDLMIVDSLLGSTGQNSADVNSDGFVNFTDLALVTKAIAATADERNALISERLDVNDDGDIDIEDLKAIDKLLGSIGQYAEDVNLDGVVNILDLVLVANAIGSSGSSAPALYHNLTERITAEQVQRWLTEARLSTETSLAFQNGIIVLEHLLATLTPKSTALLPNYPNPFNPETWIPYRLAEPADVTVTIYAANGALVRTLEVGHQPEGTYQSRGRAVYWDGKNEFGDTVASGPYFYTLTAGKFTATRKMLIRK